MAQDIRAVIPEPFPSRTVDCSPVERAYQVDHRFHIAYILTLGVAENFRGIGLGKCQQVMSGYEESTQLGVYR